MADLLRSFAPPLCLLAACVLGRVSRGRRPSLALLARLGTRLLDRLSLRGNGIFSVHSETLVLAADAFRTWIVIHVVGRAADEVALGIAARASDALAHRAYVTVRIGRDTND